MPRWFTRPNLTTFVIRRSVARFGLVLGYLRAYRMPSELGWYRWRVV
jgi:hypothetical protein